MRVLLVNSPIRLDAKPNCIPYGLAIIASLLRDDGFDVEIYDINALRPEKSEILNTLGNKAWDVVGVSGLITTYKFQKWLIPELKKMNPSAIVVSGGGLATSNGDFLFKSTPVDIIVTGEGELTMLALCRAIGSKMDWRDVPGICFKRNGTVNQTEPVGNIHDLDSIPVPAWDLLPMDIYLANSIWGDVAGNSSGFLLDVKVTRSMNIISSRGCPFGCKYCYHLFGRSNYRFRSAQNVVDEVEQLVSRYNVDFIGFVDDNMMADEKRLVEFCEMMRKKDFPVAWGCHGRVTSAKPDILNRMAETGCVWIGYGIESGSQRILDYMNKRANVVQAKQAIINTRKAGIFPNTTFIYGYPGETRQTIQETVEFKRELDIHCGSFFATPYPGTPLHEEIKHKIPDEESFISLLGNATDFCINLTDFPEDEFFKLKYRMDNNIDVL